MSWQERLAAIPAGKPPSSLQKETNSGFRRGGGNRIASVQRLAISTLTIFQTHCNILA
jgi:hypothetical protein